VRQPLGASLWPLTGLPACKTFLLFFHEVEVGELSQPLLPIGILADISNPHLDLTETMPWSLEADRN